MSFGLFSNAVALYIGFVCPCAGQVQQWIDRSSYRGGRTGYRLIYNTVSPTEQLNGTAPLAQDKSNSSNNTLNEYYHSLHGDYSISEEMYFILTLILGECALAVFTINWRSWTTIASTARYSKGASPLQEDWFSTISRDCRDGIICELRHQLKSNRPSTELEWRRIRARD